MKIIKILNNNAVLVENDSMEQVVMGRGIAFGRKVGEEVREDVIDRYYCLSDPELNKQLIELLKFANPSLVSIVQESVEEAKLEMQDRISDTLYVRLIDHFMTSVQRYRNNISIVCPLVSDVKCFYPVEYGLAKKLVANVNALFDVNLDENEVTFVTLHIVDSTICDSQNMVVTKITEFIKGALRIVRNYYGIQLDTDSISYYRFVSHLRFFASRLFSDIPYEPQEQCSDLVEVIKVKYPTSFKCSLLIEEFINKTYSFDIGNDELLYLTIHIQRIIEENNYQ